MMKMMTHQSFVVLQTMNLWWSPKNKTLELLFFSRVKRVKKRATKKPARLYIQLYKPNYKCKLFQRAHIEEERKTLLGSLYYLDVTFIILFWKRTRLLIFKIIIV